MKLQKPTNINYCATVVEIDKTKSLEGLSNLKAAYIFGNQVLISKDIKSRTKGLYFPVECALSSEFLSANNLFRKAELNKDSTKKGYFENNKRIKCVKFRGHDSEGFFIEISSLDFLNIDTSKLKLGDEFDTIENTPICTKYVPKISRTPGQGKSKSKAGHQKISKLAEGQFKFHKDTAMLYKNMHLLKPNDIISISDKFHGTSGVSSNLRCLRKLSKLEHILFFFGVNIDIFEYQPIFASRKVIQNDDINKTYHPKSTDMRYIADQVMQNHLSEGMTAYYELVGYTETGAMVQKGYDYGFQPLGKGETYKYDTHFGIVVYRVTYTSVSGEVFEMSAQAVRDWSLRQGLTPVRQFYYGSVKELYKQLLGRNITTNSDWRPKFLEALKKECLEIDCDVCKTKVPREGIVLRIEDRNLRVFKLKSTRFLEKETKALSKGEVDLETIG